MTALDKS